MKKALLPLIALLILSGCGLAQQARLQSGANTAMAEIQSDCMFLPMLSQQEAAAWKRSAKAMEQCEPVVSFEAKNEATQEALNCGERAMRESILPYSYSKPAFEKLLSERKAEYMAYLNGKISNEEAGLKRQQRIMNYMKGGTEGSYQAYASCKIAAMQKNIAPAYPPALMPAFSQYSANMVSYAREADKKKLPLEDFEAGEGQLWAQFMAQEGQLTSQYQAQDLQMRQRYFQTGAQILANQNKQSAGECSSVSIPPIATAGCRSVCINGQWSEVC